jgi:hypothetical protein
LDLQEEGIILKEFSFPTERNENKPPGLIDFHGLYVREAVKYAKDYIRKAKEEGTLVQLQFIVGIGNHSRGNKPQIKPAIEHLLQQEGLTHSIHPMNKGILVVDLKSPSPSGDVGKRVSASDLRPHMLST